MNSRQWSQSVRFVLLAVAPSFAGLAPAFGRVNVQPTPVAPKGPAGPSFRSPWIQNPVAFNRMPGAGSQRVPIGGMANSIPRLSFPKNAGMQPDLPGFQPAQAQDAPAANVLDSLSNKARSIDKAMGTGNIHKALDGIQQLFGEKHVGGEAAPLFAAGKPPQAPPLTESDLVGRYQARIAVQGPFLVIDLKLKKDGTYEIRSGDLDQVTPVFSGRWQLRDGRLFGVHEVPGMGEVSIEMELTGVTVAQLDSETGAQVQITSPLFDNQPIPFRVARRATPYFPEPIAPGGPSVVSLTESELVGPYQARPDVEGPFLGFDFNFKKGGAYEIQVGNGNEVSPVFSGRWQLRDGSRLFGVHEVPGKGDVWFEMDLTGVTAAQLDSEEGVLASIKSSLFENNTRPFWVARRKTPKVDFDR